MLEERKERRRPHILTVIEEQKLLASAVDHVRLLVILIVDTGLRSGREALALKWADVDFAFNYIRIVHSKTPAGIRCIPMTDRCATELKRWRTLGGPEFSEYVFAKPQDPSTHYRDIRRNWANALKAAGLPYFRIYDLRHTFATRLMQADTPQVLAAQMMGHSSPNMLQTYAKPTDEYLRLAISKMEALRKAAVLQSVEGQLIQ